jgi:hypothetical protein
MIERDIKSELLKWKKSVEKKPLILRGARQGGKQSYLGGKGTFAFIRLKKSF